LQPDFLHDVSPDDKSLFIVCIAVACSYCRPAPVLCAGGSQYSVNLLVMAEIISSKCFTCAGGRLKTHWAGNDCCQDALWSVHISSRGNILAQKRACCVENARKVFNLAVLFALQPRFCAQNLTRG
jgi:hypothetical protein